MKFDFYLLERNIATNELSVTAEFKYACDAVLAAQKFNEVFESEKEYGVSVDPMIWKGKAEWK